MPSCLLGSDLQWSSFSLLVVLSLVLLSLAQAPWTESLSRATSTKSRQGSPCLITNVILSNTIFLSAYLVPAVFIFQGISVGASFGTAYGMLMVKEHCVSFLLLEQCFEYGL